MEEKEQFEEWIKLKERIHFRKSAPRISEGDIWWCSCGKNVGVEINGKNGQFSRPVFICKKLGRFGFIGIPLTSQKKEGEWYVKFDFQEKEETAVLSQVRMLSVSRLINRMGRLDDGDAKRIKKGLIKLFE